MNDVRTILRNIDISADIMLSRLIGGIKKCGAKQSRARACSASFSPFVSWRFSYGGASPSTPFFMITSLSVSSASPGRRHKTEISVTHDFVINKIADYALKAKFYGDPLNELDERRHAAEVKLSTREFRTMFAPDYERLGGDFAATESHSKKAHGLFNKSKTFCGMHVGRDMTRSILRTTILGRNTIPDIYRWYEHGGDPFNRTRDPTGPLLRREIGGFLFIKCVGQDSEYRTR